MLVLSTKPLQKLTGFFFYGPTDIWGYRSSLTELEKGVEISEVCKPDRSLEENGVHKASIRHELNISGRRKRRGAKNEKLDDFELAPYLILGIIF